MSCAASPCHPLAATQQRLRCVRQALDAGTYAIAPSNSPTRSPPHDEHNALPLIEGDNKGNLPSVDDLTDANVTGITVARRSRHGDEVGRDPLLLRGRQLVVGEIELSLLRRVDGYLQPGISI